MGPGLRRGDSRPSRRRGLTPSLVVPARSAHNLPASATTLAERYCRSLPYPAPTPVSPSRKRPTRVAILGGGCASLTAAYELTRPEQDGRYEVTVYQQGWRLGGKGASGRGPSDRIEEHGLHLWMGFYENAFRMMRDCYAERAADPARTRLARFEDAFSPAPLVAVTDRVPGDPSKWEAWLAHFPAGRGLPGDPPEAGSPFTIASYLRQSVMLVRALIRSAHGMAEREADATRADAVADLLSRLVRYGELAAVTALFEAADALKHAMDGWLPAPARDGAGMILQLLDVLARATRGHLQQLATGDTEVRRIWQVVDLILAIVRGSTMHGLAVDPRGFDAINDWDWREWLRQHGASEQSLDSGFMRGIYDLAFAYEDGDVTRPRLAAGVALRGAMRMFFTYRGSLFWRMNAGMGDVVFSPLYQVLRARGVHFEFFHRLTNVGLGSDRAHVASLDFDVQARIKRGRAYQPLVDVHGVPSWPSQPDYKQLVQGERLLKEERRFESHWEHRREGTRTLHVGDDFDFVVLGVSIGAVPHVAPELVAASPSWRAMVTHVKSVPTQALQLWVRESPAKLGWPHGEGVNLSGFVEPFDTWADMSHLIPEESHSARVQSVAYFCSVLPDRPAEEQADEGFPMQQRAVVRDNAVTFIERDLPALWPKLRNAQGAVRWELLVGGHAPARRLRTPEAIDDQYWTANVNPTDRYVLSLPGSTRYRLSPLDATFDNLTIAGDWTATGLDTGCIESAVISGRLASHALSQFPPLADIVGYDHP